MPCSDVSLYLHHLDAWAFSLNYYIGMLQRRQELSQQGPAVGSITVLKEQKSAFTVDSPILTPLPHSPATQMVESSVPIRLDVLTGQ